MTRYRRPLAEGRTFRCSNCGRIKHVKYVPTSSLCRSCAAQKRRSEQNVLIAVADNIVVTSEVEKRLSKKAENEIPKSQRIIVGEWLHRWGILFFAMTSYFVARAVSDAVIPTREYTGLFWIVIFVWSLGLPILMMNLIDRVLDEPRKVRGVQINTRVKELADERKKRIEEAKLFYSSPEWLKTRELVIKEEGHTCSECHKRINKKSDITVDHILPRSKYPDLALKRDNLRVLCRSCNSSKGDREESELLISNSIYKF